MQTHTVRTEAATAHGLGVTGRLVVGGTVSTGLLLGGFIVAAMTLAGRMNGGALLPTSIGLFLVGAIAGLLVSVVAGVFGRPDGWSIPDASRAALKGMLYAVPACVFGALVAGWMGMVMIGLYLDRAAPVVGSVIAALIAAAIMVGTFRVTCEAAANVLRRVRARG